ncbi:MAG TPA: methylmalonyl-CoA mutase family protein, partial [Acidobacteriaceae bacterium]|nr:methylmalonyl-CoA mutase family protein [Acidobacteriaceae bacterium]
LGGTLSAIESGWVQQQIQTAAYAWQRKVDSGETIVVGVNEFRIEEQSTPKIERLNPELEHRQVERLQALRLRRDQQPWQDALRQLNDAARSDANLMPYIMRAVEALATVGEIADTLRSIFGEYRESVAL